MSTIYNMALFNSYDISELKAVYSVKKGEEFVKTFSDGILEETEYLTSFIRRSKALIFEQVKSNISTNKSVKIELYSIRSFNFSKVGGFSANSPSECYKSYNEYAYDYCPTSFLYNPNYTINRFNLWRSKDFLINLAKKLELPDTMYFIIQSKIVEDDNRLFKNDNITEYISSLVLVLRFTH